MDIEVLTQTTEQGLGIATLNRPKALNALNTNMVDLLHDAYQRWGADPNVHAIVLQGTGDKAFCAGGDIKSVVALANEGKPAEAVRFFHHEYTTNLAIHLLQKPHIALIDGITMGGGVGVSVHGPVRVATERTLFAMPECGIGLFPDVGGSWFLPRLPLDGMGLYLALTGARLRGLEVKIAGIATHYVDSALVTEAVARVGGLGVAARNVAAVDAVLKELEARSTSAPSTTELASNADAIQQVFGGRPTLQQVYARLEARQDDWAVATRSLLARGSPLSQRVTWEQLRRGAAAGLLQECLEMEARIAQHMLERQSDFAEGVRATLVDRDNAPKWRHANIEQVPQSEVDGYFAEVVPSLSLRGRL